ncbi:M15 family metallopeptidase [Candidatus Saccharibacteria bacterium]|nr:M15 family metallopeptidase [Candidatus Saccharibacteria bacterium]
MRKNKKKTYATSIAIAVLLIGVVFLAWPKNQPVSGIHATAPKTATPTPSPKPVEFDKTQHSTDISSSLWVVVNKGRVLPSNYAPDGLVVPNVPLRYSTSSSEMHVRADTAAAMESLFKAASTQGINLKLASGYRSYSYQVSVYGGYVKSDGVTQADTYSARPGHSEHQTGLAADLEPIDRQCEVEQCFENTPEGQWLAANSYKYGFIIRYGKTTQNLTGYQYEPWHVRFVGIDLANQIQVSGQTLEQFFGLPTYPDYPAQSYQLKESTSAE